MENIFSLVGAISGCLSLLGIVYLFGVWRGKVDNSLQCLKDYPPAEMWTMTKTLWEVYVINALHHRPDLAEHGSAFKLKREGVALIPDYMKPLLERIPRPLDEESIATGYLVVKHIGLDTIGKMSEEMGLSVQESIAILSTYISNNVSPKIP